MARNTRTRLPPRRHQDSPPPSSPPTTPTPKTSGRGGRGGYRRRRPESPIRMNEHELFAAEEAARQAREQEKARDIRLAEEKKEKERKAKSLLDAQSRARKNSKEVSRPKEPPKRVAFSPPKQPSTPKKPKNVRLRWGPPSNVRERLTVTQAIKDANDIAVGPENAPSSDTERSSDMDWENMIDRREERALQENQELPYRYTVTAVPKERRPPAQCPITIWFNEIGED